MPSYDLGNSTTMISAVAWNYASPFFQIRIYVAGERNELQEYSFSRNADGVSRDADGWIVPNRTRVGLVSQGTLRPNVPLSAVAAVMLENGCNPKVYFHPRSIIAEWDVCARSMFPAGLAKVGEKSIARRNIEEETRVKIQEEEERKREEQRKREEEIKREEARKREEEEEKKKKGPALTAEDAKQKQEMTKVKVGQKVRVESQALLDKIRNQAGCEMGYEWQKTEKGWKCAGGRHELTDAQFAAL
ncbi:U1 snRNP protein [Hypoxylon texense]